MSDETRSVFDGVEHAYRRLRRAERELVDARGDFERMCERATTLGISVGLDVSPMLPGDPPLMPLEIEPQSLRVVEGRQG